MDKWPLLPHHRAENMASKLAEKAPSWFTRLLMPEIIEIKGELKAMSVKIDSTNTRIESVREELLSKNESLRNEMMSMKAELKAEIAKVDSSVKDLDNRLDIVQRLAVLEAKQREYERNRPSAQ